MALIAQNQEPSASCDAQGDSLWPLAALAKAEESPRGPMLHLLALCRCFSCLVCSQHTLSKAKCQWSFFGQVSSHHTHSPAGLHAVTPLALRVSLLQLSGAQCKSEIAPSLSLC